MAPWAEHPGTITRIDRFDGTAVEVPASEVPEEGRFVVLTREGAPERVPIVRVETLPTDGRGQLVPRESAAYIRVMEFAPDGRMVRSSIRVRQPG